MSEALDHFRSIAAAIRPDGDVLEEDITFGEVRELLAELDDARRLLRTTSRELGQQDLRLQEAYARLRRKGAADFHANVNTAMEDIHEAYARLRTQKP